MPRLSVAEKQRRYRARQDADPAKREAYLAKGRQKWREKREQGAYYKPISEQSEREKRAKRKAWRRAQEQSRRKTKQASAIVTSPLSPDSEEQPVPVEKVLEKVCYNVKMQNYMVAWYLTISRKHAQQCQLSTFSVMVPAHNTGRRATFTC